MIINANKIKSILHHGHYFEIANTLKIFEKFQIPTKRNTTKKNLQLSNAN